jgi:uncharacterized repeat protein (TIGR01451 family)
MAACLVLLFIALVIPLYFVVLPPAAHGVSTSVVISQVYGGGGGIRNGKLKNGYIELFNRGTQTVNLNGWSAQYAFADGVTWEMTPLAGTIAPGQYYLIQEAPIFGGTVNLPRQDATGTIRINPNWGKVALVRNQTPIATGVSCPSGSGIVDFVGYGVGTNCFEGGGPAPTPNDVTPLALFRLANGCIDTDNNPTDFVTGAPFPRNTASSRGSCRQADLRTTKTAPSSVLANGTVNYTIQVTNNGPDEAINVLVTDTLPAGLVNVDASDRGAVSGATITWPYIPSLARGESKSFTVTAIAPATGQTLVNRARSASETFDPNPGNNAATTLTTVQSAIKSEANSLTATITSSDVCVGPGQVLTVEVEIINSGLTPKADNTDPEFIAQFPPELRGIFCFSSRGACNVPRSANAARWNGSLAVGEIVTITFLVQVASSNLPAGAPLCMVLTSFFDSDNNGSNDSSRSLRECVEINCPFDDEPGDPISAESPASDQKAGSVLIYNFYSSSSSGAGAENTRFSITNTHNYETAFVHLFFVNGSNGSVADAFVCLTPNQTASFLASDIDPGVSGYLVAVAVERETGCPLDFNYLIGDEHVKLSSGHAANLGAEAFASLYTGTHPDCDPEATKAIVALDGISYNAAPRALALDNIPSPSDGASTLLVINRLGGDLSTGANVIGSVFGLLYDEVENGYSLSFSGGCQFRAMLSNDFPRTTPRLSQVIRGGQTGWMKFWSAEDRALTGAAITFNSNQATAPSAFSGGRNLHHLTLTNSAKFAIPLFAPNCN